MKKIFFAVTMLAAVYTISAQDPMIEKSTASNNVPESIHTSFVVTHPGVTVIAWEPVNDNWCATYKNENNRLINVYYNTQPWYLERNESYIEVLPVSNTFVPEAVITNAINTYGTDLYSITALKPAENTSEGMYQLCLIKNGVSDRVMMNGEGVVFTDTKKKNSKL